MLALPSQQNAVRCPEVAARRVSIDGSSDGGGKNLPGRNEVGVEVDCNPDLRQARQRIAGRPKFDGPGGLSGVPGLRVPTTSLSRPETEREQT